MTEVNLEEYKGYQIKVSTSGSFYAYLDTEVAQSDKDLTKLKEWIDRVSKVKFDFPCYTREGYGDVQYIEASVTSDLGKSRYGGAREFRVSWKDSSGTNRWAKREAKQIAKLTPTNFVKFQEAKRLRVESEKLIAKARDGLKLSP